MPIAASVSQHTPQHYRCVVDSNVAAPIDHTNGYENQRDYQAERAWSLVVDDNILYNTQQK